MGLMHVPGLLFLDEPTTGLDPQSRANLWQHIRALHAEHGTTLFLTTHYLDEADALCDRILVIDGGRLVAEGTPEELKSTVAGDTVALGTDAPARVAELAATMPGATGVRVEGGVVSLCVPRASTALPVLLLLSGILLPMSLAPGWLYTLSRFNPFVYVVDAGRAAFVGDLGGVTVGLGVLAAAVLATLAVMFGARTFQRESA